MLNSEKTIEGFGGTVEDSDRDFVQSLERGLEVVRSFNEDHPRQTLSEVALSTGYSRAACRRLLHTLITLGYVGVDNRKFFLQPRVLEIGYSFLSSLPFRTIVEPFIEDLSDKVKESVSVSVLDGADIVFPVAGSVGLGSIAAAKQAGAGHSVMWVDSNGCVSDKADCSWFVGTVAKGVEPSVKAAILSAAKGTFKAGTYVGTLKNSGTALEYGGVSVPAALKAKIAKAKAGVIAGTISVNPNKYPAS